MKTIVQLASTFPRWENDTEPKFVYELCTKLTNEFNIIALVPHFSNAKTEEQMNGIKVIRFKYFFEKYQKLAYEGGIANNLKRNRLIALLIPFFLFFNLLSLIKLLKNNNIDAIHAHWIIPQGIIAILARFISRKRIPILCTSHGGDLYCFNNWLTNKIKAFVLNRCEAISVVSTAMKTDTSIYGIDAKKIHILPMGTDLINKFYYDDTVTKKKNNILFVGRLVPKKGVDILLQSLKYIPNNLIDFQLDIIGDGPEKNHLENLTRELKLNQKVNFIGPKRYEELPIIYRQYPISVVPSVTADNGDREGFGLVCVEAMGCGCTVVASNYGAITDIISDGQTGVIVPQKSPQELGKAISYLLSNPQKNKELSANAIKSVQKFDWEHIGQRYSSLINSIS